MILVSKRNGNLEWSVRCLRQFLCWSPRLGWESIIFCHWLLSVCPSLHLAICLSVTLLLQIDSSFLFIDGIEPFFGRHFSMWHSTKRCSLIFDLGPVTPKIYSPKLLAIMLHYHVATRGCTVGMAALPAESRQSTELRGRPLLPWQRNLAYAWRSRRLPACFVNSLDQLSVIRNIFSLCPCLSCYLLLYLSVFVCKWASAVQCRLVVSCSIVSAADSWVLYM